MSNVAVDGLKINYELDGEGSYIVLLHGHGSNLHFYDSLAGSLKKGYTVVRYDQRGYGLTNKPPKPPFSTELWADDLYRFLKKLRVRKAVVAGHSMGGRICATFAMNHPEMVMGLITLNTTWFGSNPKAADKLEENAIRVEKEGIQAALDCCPWINTISKRFPKIKELEIRELLKNDAVGYALGSRAVAKDFRGGSRDDILKALQCPTLILIGDRDSAPIKGAITMSRGIKHSRLAVVPNSGHFSILEKPRISQATIADFLKEIKSA